MTEPSNPAPRPELADASGRAVKRRLDWLVLVLVCAAVAALVCRDASAPAEPSTAAGRLNGEGAAAPLAEQVVAPAAPAVREAVAPATSSPAIAHRLRLQLRGAPAAELRGEATVRRRDGAVEAVRFEGGELVVEARETVDAVSVHVPGFAVVWPVLRRDTNVLEVAMRRAGAIRIELRDTTGRALAGRFVWGQCQGVRDAGSVDCSGTARAVTDERGIAVLADLVPGTWSVGSYRVAEWDAVVAEGLVVTEGVATGHTLVANVWPSERCGGFWFARAAAPGLTVADTLVSDRVFVVGTQRYELHAVEGQVRCVVRGLPGEVLVGHLGAVDPVDPAAEPVPLSPAITVTIGAVVPWTPVWLR